MTISGVLVFAAATGRLLSLRETRPTRTGSRPFALRHVFEGRMGLVLMAIILWNVVLAMTLWGPFISLHASDAMGLSMAGRLVLAISALTRHDARTGFAAESPGANDKVQISP